MFPRAPFVENYPMSDWHILRAFWVACRKSIQQFARLYLKFKILAFVLRTFVVEGAGSSLIFVECSKLTREREMEKGRKSLPTYEVHSRCH